MLFYLFGQLLVFFLDLRNALFCFNDYISKHGVIFIDSFNGVLQLSHVLISFDTLLSEANNFLVFALQHAFIFTVLGQLVFVVFFHLGYGFLEILNL